jgi:hypothetical protein
VNCVSTMDLVIECTFDSRAMNLSSYCVAE